MYKCDIYICTYLNFKYFSLQRIEYNISEVFEKNYINHESRVFQIYISSLVAVSSYSKKTTPK